MTETLHISVNIVYSSLKKSKTSDSNIFSRDQIIKKAQEYIKTLIEEKIPKSYGCTPIIVHRIYPEELGIKDIKKE